MNIHGFKEERIYTQVLPSWGAVSEQRKEQWGFAYICGWSGGKHPNEKKGD